MDPSRLNTRVLKEPRGMIRIIQLVSAFLHTKAFERLQFCIVVNCLILKCAQLYTCRFLPFSPFQQRPLLIRLPRSPSPATTKATLTCTTTRRRHTQWSTPSTWRTFPWRTWTAVARMRLPQRSCPSTFPPQHSSSWLRVSSASSTP